MQTAVQNSLRRIAEAKRQIETDPDVDALAVTGFAAHRPTKLDMLILFSMQHRGAEQRETSFGLRYRETANL